MKWNIKCPARKLNEIWNAHVENEMKYEMALHQDSDKKTFCGLLKVESCQKRLKKW